MMHSENMAASPTQGPYFENPQSIFDLVNFRISEFIGLSGGLVTRLCESEYGITREEWQFVAMLAELKAASPSELAALTTIDRSQASKTLRALMGKGLLVRQAVPGDGRKARVLLSEEGRQLYALIFPRVVQLHQDVLEDLTAQDRQALARYLNVMQARALKLTQIKPLKPLGAVGRRQGGSRANWRKTMVQKP